MPAVSDLCVGGPWGNNRASSGSGLNSDTRHEIFKAMPRLRKLTVKRFKRLGEMKINLGTTTLLIGSNNAGKSSVLQAIQFAVSLAQSSRLIGGVPWADDKYELSFSQTQLLYCPVSDAMTLASGGKLVEDAGQRVEVTFLLEDGTSSVVSLRKGRNRNLKVAIEGQKLGMQLQDLANPYSVYAPGLAGIPRAEHFMSAGLVRRAVARGDANLVLRNVLLQISKDAPKWARFMADMRALFPQMEMRVVFEPEQDEHVGVFMSHDGGPEVPLDAAGTSILQASQLLSYVSLFEPRLLVLDEPDSHLHPDRQRKLCRRLGEIAAERDFQVVMSSHSRHVLDALSRKANVVWLNRGVVVDEEDIDTTKVLLELGALDSVDYFADGQIRCLVATEDSDQRYIETLLESSGFEMDDVEVVSFPGCSQIEAAIVLGCFLMKKAPHIRLIVHRDRDYLPAKSIQTFIERLAAKGIIPFVTAGNDIEGYFTRADHLASANPELLGTRAQELLDQAIQDSEEKSIKAIINLRIEQAFKARNKGGDSPNHGQIAIDAMDDYNAAPATMFRGDVILGRIASLLQQELGHNPQITRVTPQLDVPELRQIKEQIWGAAPAAEL
jgi:AAA domain, putative AbiEii toxin, Type IV TA system/AAA ATPase domain